MFLNNYIDRILIAVGYSICLVLSVLIIRKLSLYLRSVVVAFKLPGPPVDSILGNVLLFNRKDVIEYYFRNGYKNYGPIVRLWGVFMPYFGLLEPEHISVILSSKQHVNKPFYYRFLRNSLGNGIIINNGEKWRFHRKLIQPVFHIQNMEKTIPIFIETANILCKKLNEAQGDVNVVHYINNWVNDVLNCAVLGEPVGDIYIKDFPFKERNFLVVKRFERPWLLLDYFYKRSSLGRDETKHHRSLSEYVRNTIKKRRSLRHQHEDLQNICFLDHLIDISERNRKFTEKDIINETRTFMHAGQDTVATATAFCIFLLAQNEDVQMKCLEEISTIFEKSSRTPTISDIRSLQYIEMCVKETLRLYPSVTFFGRTIDEDVQIGKYVFPAGSNFFVSPFVTHRLPHIYPDPERFLPERFSKENSENRHSYSFLPFSAGPRNCLGYKYSILQIKLAVATILRNFDLKPVPDKCSFTLLSRISLRASGGLWVNLKRKNLESPSK